MKYELSVRSEMERALFSQLIRTPDEEVYFYEPKLAELEFDELLKSLENLNCSILGVSEKKIQIRSSLPRTSISVVVPAFNPKSHELNRAIASIEKALLLWPKEKKEILLVDDGSDAPIVSAGGLARVIRHPKNLGTAIARNTGFSESRNEHVFFVDADDEVLPAHFRFLSAELESGSDAVASSMKLPREEFFVAKPCTIPEVISENCFGSGIGIRKSSLVIKRLLGSFEGLYSTTNRLHYEDWELHVLLALLEARVSIVPLPTYIYHVEKSGRNSVHHEHQFRSGVQVAISALERFRLIDPEKAANQAFDFLNYYADWMVSLQAGGSRRIEKLTFHESLLKIFARRVKKKFLS